MLLCQIIGNLGGDCEYKFSGNGTPMLRFNVASNSRVRDGNEWVDATEWVRVTIFGQRAESLSQILTKGQKVFISGRLEARPWIDREQNARAGLEMIADQVELLTPRDQGDQGRTPGNDSEFGNPRQQGNNQRTGYPSRGPATAAAAGRAANRRADAEIDRDDELEDLPFDLPPTQPSRRR